MPYVRVKDKETGHHLSISQERYDRDPSLWDELKSPAEYADGSPTPPKFKTSVSTGTATKTDGGSAADTKEK